MTTPIHKKGPYLIARVDSAVNDRDLAELHDALIGKLERGGAAGVVVDVAELDVLDSFAARTFRDLTAEASRHGARMVVAGLQPGVAVAMAVLGVTLEGTLVAPDVEAGLRMLNPRPAHRDQLTPAR